MTARLGIVCGLASEAEALGSWRTDPRIAVAVAGADAGRAHRLAAAMVQDGVRCLLSWGIAGGLDPVLAPGTILVAVEVRTGRRPGIVLNASLAGHLDGDGALLGVTRVITAPADKARLYRETQTRAVDMETMAIAEAARAAHVPCVAIRAISDPAHRALPDLAADAVDAAGRPMIGKVLAGLARRPWQIGALLQAKRDSDRAHAALANAAGVYIPRLLGEAESIGR